MQKTAQASKQEREEVYSCNGSMNFITLMKERDARRISAFGRFLQLMRRHHDVISGRKDARVEMEHDEMRELLDVGFDQV